MAAEKALGSRWAVFEGDAGLERLKAVRRAAVSGGEPDLSNPDEAVRYWAVERLGWRGALDTIEPSLKDPSPVVRIAAASWLGRGGRADRALPVLTAELKNPDPWTVVAALTGLDEMGDAALPALAALDTIADKDENYTARLLMSLHARLDPKR